MNKSEGNLNPNPQIKEVEIGIHNLRKIKIYPLSMADQLSLTDNINSVLTSFFNTTEGQDDSTDGNVAFVSFFIKILKDNIPEVLRFVTDTDEKSVQELTKEITNVQAAEIINIVVEDNYAEAAKNLTSLLDIVKMVQLPSRRPVPLSVDSMEDTDLNTSSPSPSEKEE